MLDISLYEGVVSGIYEIKNTINNKVYIGLSSNIRNRFNYHRYALRNSVHTNRFLQGDWDIYGEKNFMFNIIEQCSEDYLSEKEVKFIAMYRATDRKYGYNILQGGGFPDMTEEIKQRISESHKGKIVPIETVEKFSTSQIGKVMSVESRSKMSETKKKKPILQFDVNGNLIERWESSHHIRVALDIDTKAIRECCKRNNPNRKTSRGYIWIYEEDYEKDGLDLEYYRAGKNSNPKLVAKYDLDDDTLICIYPSASLAGRDNRIPHQNISRCCNGGTKTAGGYKWSFV